MDSVFLILVFPFWLLFKFIFPIKEVLVFSIDDLYNVSIL